MAFRNPKLTVDAVVVRGDKILLVKRGKTPFRGFFALPGGFVEYGESLEAACVREVFEETGIKVSVRKLVGVYSKPDRDPRGHVVSVAYLARPAAGGAKAGSDAAGVAWFPLARLPPLAFDHSEMVADAMKVL
jgi:8-oxo-dGTP diphosphatase